MELFGEEYVIKQDLKNLNGIKNPYYDLGIELADSWLAGYNKYSSVDSLLKKGREDIYEKIFEGINIAVDTLINNGVLHINEDVFFEKYYKRVFDMEDYIDVIEEVYLSISLNQEEMDAYRTARREHRSKWSGGGFGVQGAMKGALKAGGLNIVGGVAHGAFNLVGKAFDSIANSMKESSLLSSKSTKETLYDGLKKNVYAIYLALSYAFNDLTNCKVRLISRADIDQAKALLDNLSRGNIDEDVKKQMVYEILDRNPYMDETYPKLLELYPDEIQNICEIAEYFDISSFKNEMHDYFDKILSSLGDSIDLCNREEAARVRGEFLSRISKLGFTEDNPMIQSALDNFKARINKEENQAIREAYKAIDFTSVENLDDFKPKEEEFNNLTEKLESLALDLEEGTEKVISKIRNNLGQAKMKAFLNELELMDYGPDISRGEAERRARELAKTLDLDLESRWDVVNGAMARGRIRSKEDSLDDYYDDLNFSNPEEGAKSIELLKDRARNLGLAEKNSVLEKAYIRLKQVKQTGVDRPDNILGFKESMKKNRKKTFLKIGGVIFILITIYSMLLPDEEELVAKEPQEVSQKLEEEELVEEVDQELEEEEIVDITGVKADDYEVNTVDDVIAKYEEALDDDSFYLLNGASLEDIDSLSPGELLDYDYQGEIIYIYGYKLALKGENQVLLIPELEELGDQANVHSYIEYIEDIDNFEIGDSIQLMGYCRGRDDHIVLDRGAFLYP